MQTGNTDFIYKNELDKACFQHDMAYDKSKDLVKRTQSDTFLRDKAFKIANDPDYFITSMLCPLDARPYISKSAEKYKEIKELSDFGKELESNGGNVFCNIEI